jgi:Na+-transporting methylmalonyl-CoA/oxaloacetate decarboxylase gamma subunit
MFWLKIAFVVLLCLPILYFGIRFFGTLLDNAVAGKEKKDKKQNKHKRHER